MKSDMWVDIRRYVEERLLQFSYGSGIGASLTNIVTYLISTVAPAIHAIFGAQHSDAASGTPSRGTIARGNQSDLLEPYSAKTLGWVLHGNGVDVVSAPFNWDTMAGGYGSYMYHDHSSGMYGGTVYVPSHTQNANTVTIPSGVGTPTYDDLQDWLNITRSPGRLVGGVVTPNDPSDGKVDITELNGMIKTSASSTGTIVYFRKAAQTDLVLSGLAGYADKAVNWLYIDYDGGSLTYKLTTSRATFDGYTMFAVARMWIDGNTVEVLATGHSLYNKDYRAHDRLITKYGALDRASGGIISANGALGLQITDGVWYVANTKFTTTGVSTFEVWYKSGSATWVESASLNTFSQVFDGGTNKLYESYQNGNNIGTLGASKWGVYWIYLCPEGDLYVVMGTAQYNNAGAAQAASVPASLPPYCVDWARLVGRVICQKTAASLYSVETAFGNTFTLSTIVEHASTSGRSDADSHPAAAITNTATAPVVGTTVQAAIDNIAAALVGATNAIPVGGGAGIYPVWTAATGSGAPVRATSPTLVTPILGTPTSGTLTNCTGLPTAGLVAGTRGDILTAQTAGGVWTPLAKGAANAVLTGNGTDTAWSTYLITGTAGGTTNFAVSNTKTLTFTATDSYNVTIPATGTAALGAATATVSSTNDATIASHTHAVTSSSNPGGAASLLASAADGGLQLLRFGLGTDPDTDNAMKVVSAAWIGLGSAAGRAIFTDAATDTITFSDCFIGIGTTPTRLFHCVSTQNVCAIFSYTASSTNLASLAGAGINFRNLDATSGNYAILRFGDANDNAQIRMGVMNGAHSGTNQGTFFIEPSVAVTSPSTFIISPERNTKLGGTAERGTTVGTFHLDLFNGTAPTGTLTNGISLYSASGECWVIDAAGNATQLSPHDQRGEWHFYSRSTVTGKILRIDMERMLKTLNAKFGWDFVHEYEEELTNERNTNSQID
jgi:hypothetical protein